MRKIKYKQITILKFHIRKTNENVYSIGAPLYKRPRNFKTFKAAKKAIDNWEKRQYRKDQPKW